jgi:hypothetical protein
MRQSAIYVIGLLAVFLGTRINPQVHANAPTNIIQGKQELQLEASEKPTALPSELDAICRLNPSYDLNSLTAARSWNALKDQAFIASCLGSEQSAILPIIASVPDPIHTDLGFVLDRTIDAIQAAAANASYSLHAQALPWASSQFSASQNSTKSQQPQATKETSEAAYPGVLIFKKTEGGDAAPEAAKYLVFFLIPESPTTGLDRQVFFKALEMMPASAVLRFAGPTYSGSVASLSELMSELKKHTEPGPRHIHAFSGSVTNASSHLPDCPEAASDSSDDCLSLLQLPDKEAIQYLVEALKTYGYKPREIALLSEEGTTYGAQGIPTFPELLLLNFPREISRLRNAYGAQVRQPAAAATTAGQIQLELDWQDSHDNSGDSTPSYGGAQTPFSEDAVLTSLAVAIQRHGIKVLGILATDPWDVAFLIRSFRQSSPDVRLFVRDPDLLFLRLSDAGSLNGILTISNYPLIQQNQLWTTGHSGGHMVTLPSASQESEYNAIVRVLEDAQVYQDRPALLESDWPAGTPRPKELASKAKDSKTPLWVGATGTAGYFPVTLLAHQLPVPQNRFALHSLDVGKPPYLSILFWLLIAMIGLYHAAASTFSSVAPTRLKDEFDFTDKTDSITAVKGLCQASAILMIMLASFVAGSSFLFFRSADYTISPFGVSISTYHLLAIGVLLNILILGMAAAWRLFDSVVRPSIAFRKGEKFAHNGVVNIGKLLPVGIPFVAILLTALAIWTWVVLEANFANAFFHFRDLNLASGVAPSVPIVFLLGICYLGIWVYLRRLALWEYGTVDMPELTLDDTFPCEFTKNVKGIDKWMLDIPGTVWRYILLCVVTLAVLAFRPWSTMDMLEVTQVHDFAVGCFIFAFFLLWINWFRFIAVWRGLRNILQNLEKLPLRTAFNRLPRESSLPIWRWTISDGSFLPVCQGVDTFRALTHIDHNVISPRAQERFLSCVSAWTHFGAVDRQEPVRVEPPRNAVPEVAMAQAVGGRGRVTLGDVPDGSQLTGDNPPLATETGPRTIPSADRATVKPSTSSKDQKKRLHDSRDAMTAIIQELVTFLLPEYWKRGFSNSLGKVEQIDPADRRFMLAEDLVALRFYAYIRYVVSELRNLLFFMVIAFCLLFVALHTYAFRADRAIDWSFIALIAVLGGGVVLVLAQMERDALLSRLNDTKPGKLGAGFYLNLVKYGMVPVLTILGSQVPGISNLLLRWVQPALQAFR